MTNLFSFFPTQHHENFDTLWGKPGNGAPNPVAIQRTALDMENHAQTDRYNQAPWKQPHAPSALQKRAQWNRTTSLNNRFQPDTIGQTVSTRVGMIRLRFQALILFFRLFLHLFCAKLDAFHSFSLSFFFRSVFPITPLYENIFLSRSFLYKTINKTIEAFKIPYFSELSC